MSFDQMLYRSSDAQLMEAINSNNLESVRTLVSRGADINYRGQHGETPLIKSMMCEDTRICSFLLESGANPNLVTVNGYSPLVFACLQNNFEFARMLLGHNADINQRTHEGWTPLIIAATNSSVIFDHLDQPFFKNLMEIVSRYGHYRPENDPTILVNLLLQSGANPNDANIFGTTPLMAASSMANQKIIRSLIESKASIDLRDTEGKTALVYAVISTIEEVIDSLIHMRLVSHSINLADFMTLPMVAQLRPQFDPDKEYCINYLINNGADIRTKDKKGISVLTHAARTGNLRVVQNLVGYGANIHAKSQRGITPLYAAAINGHNDIVLFLLSQGVDIDEKLNDGETPLMAAVWNGQVETVALLIHKGADVNVKKLTRYKPSGETSLIRAPYINKTEKNENYDKIFKILAQAGAV